MRESSGRFIRLEREHPIYRQEASGLLRVAALPGRGDPSDRYRWLTPTG